MKIVILYISGDSSLFHIFIILFTAISGVSNHGMSAKIIQPIALFKTFQVRNQ